MKRNSPARTWNSYEASETRNGNALDDWKNTLSVPDAMLDQLVPSVSLRMFGSKQIRKKHTHNGNRLSTIQCSRSAFDKIVGICAIRVKKYKKVCKESSLA